MREALGILGRIALVLFAIAVAVPIIVFFVVVHAHSDDRSYLVPAVLLVAALVWFLKATWPRP
jgi:hypothetical protein